MNMSQSIPPVSSQLTFILQQEWEGYHFQTKTADSSTIFEVNRFGKIVASMNLDGRIFRICSGEKSFEISASGDITDFVAQVRACCNKIKDDLHKGKNPDREFSLDTSSSDDEFEGTDFSLSGQTAGFSTGASTPCIGLASTSSGTGEEFSIGFPTPFSPSHTGVRTPSSRGSEFTIESLSDSFSI